VGVNKIIEKDHTIISHDASLQPGADEVRYFGRSYEAFWPHRGVEAVIYRLCNPRALPNICHRSQSGLTAGWHWTGGFFITFANDRLGAERGNHAPAFVVRAAYLLLAGAYAHADEPAVITLSCGGTAKANIGNNEGQRKPINKVELLVDLAEHKISFAGYVAEIDDVDGMNVFFGSNDPATGDINVDSGLMSATTRVRRRNEPRAGSGRRSSARVFTDISLPAPAQSDRADPEAVRFRLTSNATVKAAFEAETGWALRHQGGT
jgi:hypothetical protein